MPRALHARRVPRHHLMVHRPPPPRGRSSTRVNAEPAKLSDLILALLGVVMLGGLALSAAFVLTSGATAP